MRKRAFILILAILVLVCSCSTTSHVNVAGLAIDLLPANAIKRNIDVYQLMDGTLPGYGDAVLESYLAADGNGIEMYLFAPTGQTIAVVRYDGQKASMESEFIPYGNVAAAYMVFDVQMCYAEADEIEKSGLSVSETLSGETRSRVISHGSETLYRIEYSGNTCVVTNVPLEYSYVLETLE